MKAFYFVFGVLLLLGIAGESYGQKFGDKLRVRTVRANLLAISPDGKEIATANMFGGIKFYDLSTGIQTNELDGSMVDTQPNDIGKIQYSRDGRHFFVLRRHASGESELVIYDVSSGAIVRKFNGRMNGTLLVSPSEKLIVIETSEHALELFDFQKGTKIKTFGNRMLPARTAVAGISPDDKYLIAHDGERGVFFINIYSERNEKSEKIPPSRTDGESKPGEFHPLYTASLLHFNRRLYFSPSGKYFATLYDLNTRIAIWDSEKMKVISTSTMPAEKEIQSIGIESSAIVWASDEKSVVCMLKDNNREPRFEIAEIDVSAESKMAVCEVSSQISEVEEWSVSDIVAGKDGKVYFTNRFRDCNIWMTDFSGQARPVVKSPVEDFTVQAGAFSSDHHNMFHANAKGEIFWWDLYQGIYKGKFKQLKLAIHSLKFSADNAKLIVTGEQAPWSGQGRGMTYIFDIKSGTQDSRKENIHAGDLRGTQVNNLKSERFYGWSLNEGTLFINDHADRSLILAASSQAGKDFVVVSPELYIDGTEKGIQELLFVREGNKNVGIDGYKAKFGKRNLIREFFFPGQVSRLVNPPTVTINKISDQLQQYSIRAVNEKNGIGRIEIYINGKLIHEDARKLASSSPMSLADEPSVTMVLDLSREQQVLPGKTNLLEVIAYDKGNGVAAEPVTLHVERQGPVPPPASKPLPEQPGTVVDVPQKDKVSKPLPVPPEKDADIQRKVGAPRFWALVVGVSNYANSDLNLRYSARDAEAVAKALIVAGSNLFTPANMRVMKLTSEDDYNKRPSRTNIMKAVEKIKKEADYGDVLLVYLAGHGISHKSDQEDFYFLTADARTADYQSPETRQTQSISGKEIMGLLNETRAQKQVLIMDACATGTLVNNLIAGRDLTEAVRRGLERMRDRTATYILAANAADQKSYESGAYGQGILTHTILQGMRGAALREGKYVDVSHLLQYTRDQVELRAREMDLSQVPMIVAPKKDDSFDIGLLSIADRAKIPVADPKPVFTKTIFLQANEFSDTKEFSQLIDDRLYELSYQGASPPIAFVQTDYPNAYHLAGEYKIVQNTVILNAKLFLNKVSKGIIRFSGEPRALADAVLGQVTALLNQ